MDQSARPLPVTLFCFFLMTGGLLAILHAFSGATAVHSAFHPALRAVACLAVFTGVSGVWAMEKWGLWTTMAATFAFMGVDLAFGVFHPIEALMPLASLCLLPWRSKFR
jgi:hypothetical protein